MITKILTEKELTAKAVDYSKNIMYNGIAVRLGFINGYMLGVEHAKSIQKDQAFLNFIATTGLSAADQNIIKGVYFKYIEQCQ